jgi:hypothetical protein
VPVDPPALIHDVVTGEGHRSRPDPILTLENA